MLRKQLKAHEDENSKLQEELSTQRKQYGVIVNKLIAASLGPQSKVPESSLNSHDNSSMPRSRIPWADQFDDESECDDTHATAMSLTSTSIQPAMGETASTGNRAGGVNPAPATHQDNVSDDAGGFRKFMNQCTHAPGTMPDSSAAPW